MALTTRLGIGISASGASAASSEIARVYQELRNGTMSVMDANSTLASYSEGISAQVKALRLLNAESRTSHAATLEFMRGLSSVASIGNTLTGVYNAWQLSQIRIGQQTESLADAQDELRRVQERLAIVTRDLGADSVYAQSLISEEASLKRRVASATEDLTAAQQSLNFQYVSTGLSLVQCIPAVYTLTSHFREFQALISTLTLSQVATDLGLIATGATGAAATIQALTGIGTIVLPVTFSYAWVKAAQESEYWTKPNENAPPGPGNSGGIFLPQEIMKWYSETIKQGGPGIFGFGVGMGGAGTDTNVLADAFAKANQPYLDAINSKAEITRDITQNNWIYEASDSDEIIDTIMEKLSEMGVE